MCELSKRGMIGMLVSSGPFLNLARAQARVFGVPDLPLIEIAHPLGGITKEAVMGRALVAAGQVKRLIEAWQK